MSGQEKNYEMDDEQVNAALKNFRESVHTWSEQELGRTRTVQRAPSAGFWRVMANPVMGWALAGVLVVGGVGIPATVSHQRQVAALQAAAIAEQHRLQSEKEAKQLELAMDDEELLSHVDSDIAQATPDAMEPLARMMVDTTVK